MTERKPVAPYYAVALLWLLGGLCLPLYTVTAYGLLAAVSTAVFFLVEKLCRGGGTVAGTTGGEKEKSAPAKNPPAKEESGNPELEKMLKDGRLALSEMKRLDDNIADPSVSADIVRLSQVSENLSGGEGRPGQAPSDSEIHGLLFTNHVKTAERL